MNDPKDAVLKRLAERHDYWTIRQTTYLLAGEMANAEGAGQLARWCRRAYLAELKDPKPAEVRHG